MKDSFLVQCFIYAIETANSFLHCMDFSTTMIYGLPGSSLSRASLNASRGYDSRYEERFSSRCGLRCHLTNTHASCRYVRALAINEHPCANPLINGQHALHFIKPNRRKLIKTASCSTIHFPSHV